MDEASILIGITEIAVAFAGFSGVATALGGRHDSHFWTPSRRALFGDLLLQSAIALFSSLLALASLAAVGSDAPRIWAFWSLVWAVFGTIGTTAGLRRARAVTRLPGPERFVGPIAISGFTALILLQLYNAWVLQLFWPYLAALLGNLGFAFVQFVRLVLPRSGELEDPPADA